MKNVAESTDYVPIHGTKTFSGPIAKILIAKIFRWTGVER